MEKCLQRSPISQNSLFLFLTPHQRKLDVIQRTGRRSHSDNNQQLPSGSNFETKSQAIEAAYEEHVRGEKNMGN